MQAEGTTALSCSSIQGQEEMETANDENDMQNMLTIDKLIFLRERDLWRKSDSGLGDKVQGTVGVITRDWKLCSWVAGKGVM